MSKATKMKGYSEGHLDRLARKASIESMALRELENENIENQFGEYGVIVCDQERDFEYPSIEKDENDKVQFDASDHENKCEMEVTPPCEMSTTTKDGLREWAIKFNVNRNVVSGLLKTLINTHQCHHDLPRDYRSLLKTPRTTNVREILPGFYVHIGLVQGLENVARQFSLHHKITLNIHIDGIPISGSSKSHMWPIQVHVIEAELSKPFFVGLWHGDGKPANCNEFLQEFVDEWKLVLDNGIDVNFENVKVEVNAFIADGPARASITCVIGHSGILGCSKCKQRGRKVNGFLIYSTKCGELRKDEDFYDFEDNDHIKEESVLLSLNVGLVSRVPLDYQHLVCQGVMKRILTYWTGGEGQKGRFSARQRRIVSTNLIQLAKCVPLEFARKPRSLCDPKFWKATEFRQFLLYTGPLVLRAVMQPQYYHHFMTLHCAILILSNPKHCVEYNGYADFLLQDFVADFIKLYGPHTLAYCVHGLLHLSADVLLLGPLDSFSTFKFENNLQVMKNLIKSTNKPLQQVTNRLHEQAFYTSPISDKPTLLPSMPHEKGPTLSNSNVQQFQSLQCKDFRIRLNDKDNVVLLKNGKLVKVENIVKNSDRYLIIGRKYTKAIRELYSYPCSSTEFGIQRIDNSFGDLKSWDIDLIRSKCVSLKYRDETIIFPLLHCY